MKSHLIEGEFGKVGLNAKFRAVCCNAGWACAVVDQVAL